MELSLNDGYPHIVTCYFLDWDSVTRHEKVFLIDPATSAILDTQDISEFHGGKYYRWLVQGRVMLRVHQIDGNAVASGIFFDTYSPELSPMRKLKLSPRPTRNSSAKLRS